MNPAASTELAIDESNLKISIPETSEAGHPKQHIRYHVFVELPQRSYTLQKRYSEFTEFNAQLLATTKTSPPLGLPPKHFVHTTNTDPILIEERRKGLEEYLDAMNNTADSRWRTTAPWKQFLNLPMHDRHTSTGLERARMIDWIETTEQARTYLTSVQAHLTARHSPDTSVAQQAAETAAAKRYLVAASIKVSTLQRSLMALESAKEVSEPSLRTRSEIVRQLSARYLELENKVAEAGVLLQGSSANTAGHDRHLSTSSSIMTAASSVPPSSPTKKDQ